MAARLVAAAGVGIAAAGLCCGGDALDELLGGAGPPDGEQRFVTASSLHLRAEPNSQAASLTELPRGTQVIVTGPPERADRPQGIVGNWVPVWSMGQQGYAFDGFLLPVPPPPPSCTGLGQWAENLGFAGPAVAVEQTPCQKMGIFSDGICDETTRRPLVKGGYYQVNRGYEWGSETLRLSGVSRDALWAAARGCLPGPPDLRSQPLPTVSGEVPALALPGGPVTALVDGNTAGWEYPEGCIGFVQVSQVEADAEITVGGGC